MSKRPTDSYGMTAVQSAANVARIEWQSSGDLEAALAAGHRAAAAMPNPCDEQIRADLARRDRLPASPIFGEKG